MKIKSFRARFLFLSVVTAAFILIYLSLFSSQKNKDIFVILRYDDYCSESSTLVEDKLLKLVKQGKITCSFGVIPYSTDPSDIGKVVPLAKSKIDLVKNYVNNGSINICQHGYLHKTITSSGNNSEFAGDSYISQYQKISSGKVFLDSIFSTDVTTFIPPWNSYDSVTLRVISELGFKTISSDNLGISDNKSDLNYIPFSIYVSEINDIINYSTLPLNKTNSYIILMLHDYDFVEIDSSGGYVSIPQFEETFNKISSLSNWRVIGLDKATNNSSLFKHDNYSSNRLKSLLISYLAFIPKIRLLQFFYLQKSFVIRLFLLVLLFYLASAIIISLFVTIFFNLIKINTGNLRLIKYSTSVIVIILTLVFYLNDHIIGIHETYLITVISGFLIGTGKPHSA